LPVRALPVEADGGGAGVSAAAGGDGADGEPLMAAVGARPPGGGRLATLVFVAPERSGR